MDVARERNVDAFLIAGDLFEDHQVEAASVEGVYEAIRSHPTVRVFILPGNHDPASGPAAIWARAPFAQPLPNLKVFTAPESVEICPGAWLLASPLTQKRSTIDPSQCFLEMTPELPPSTIRIGITHGALAIGARHAPDDFPIALDAATRAGLDYVAIGHWHSSFCCDDGRLFMPGTPEPTDFGENGAGHVHLVSIEHPGAMPRIEAIKVAQLDWVHVICDGLSPEETSAQVKGALLGRTQGDSVVRLTLRGIQSDESRAQASTALRELLEGCAAFDIRDETERETTAQEEAKAREDHPLLAGVLDDLGALARSANGSGLPDQELAELCKQMNCSAADLTPEVALTARELLLRHLRECDKAC